MQYVLMDLLILLVLLCHALTIWNGIFKRQSLADFPYSLVNPALLLRLPSLSETDGAQDSKDRRAEKAEDARRREPLTPQ